MSAGKTSGVYLAGSHEFIKVGVTRDGQNWTDGVQFAVVNRDVTPTSYTWVNPAVLDTNLGLYADDYAKGTWDVFVKVTDIPEVPIFFAGYFVIR
jgi:hypothetical protein